MQNNKVTLTGSERQPLGTRLADQPADEMIEVSVILKPKTRAAIPHAHGKHVSREQFAAAHGASNATIDKVKLLGQQYNLKVTAISPERRTVKLQGTAADMMRAFEVQLDRYENDGWEYRARTGGVKLPVDLVDSVEAVLGLDNRPQAKPHYRVSRAAAATVAYSPPQVAQLYQFPEDVDGTGQTVGIIELGGGYRLADLEAYFSGLSITMPSVVFFPVDGATNDPTNLDSFPQYDIEVQLDIEVVGAVAPGAKIVVYFAPNTDQGFLDALTTAIHDAANTPSVISISWGMSEDLWTPQTMTAFDSAAQDAAALGISICAASGDDGASDGVPGGTNHVDFPGSSQNILACGGTTLQAVGGSISSETVWSGSGSGGGFSTQFSLPPWQTIVGVTPPANGGRGVPDVAGNADPETGYNVSVDGASLVVGGTSAVAPLWSGLIVLLNQKLGRNVGFLQPALYALSSSSGPFNDIVIGSNGGFSAAPGWDACTGLGSPSGRSLLAAYARLPYRTGPKISAWIPLLLS